VGFDVALNGGTGAGESAKAHKFIADKLVVGRVLHRQEASEEGVNFGRPETVAVASAGLRAVGAASCQPVSPHEIKLRFAYAKLRGCSRDVEESCVEFIKSLEDELAGKTVDNLLLFTSIGSTVRTNDRDQSEGNLGLPSGRPSRHRRLALLLRLSSLLHRPRQDRKEFSKYQ